MTKRKLTGKGTHRATARGYADGELIEVGAAVPAGVAISGEWMMEGEAVVEPEPEIAEA